MSLAKITSITGRGVAVTGNDIDTDRIIPARFMKCVTFDGLGEFLFYDVRKNADGSDRAHPLNEARFKGAAILLSGANFGCGSSREHAPQAIQKYGFRAIIAEGYAEIFFGNSTTLGMPCMTAAREDITKIAAAVEADPSLEIVVDVEAQLVGDGRALSTTPTFPYSRPTLEADKCVFNLVPCDNDFERKFAKFLQDAPDVARFSKLPSQFGFVIKYTDASTNLRNYEPDFVAVLHDGTHFLIETKGMEDVHVRHKDRAATLWCENASTLTNTKWRYLKVPQIGFNSLQPEDFEDIAAAFVA